MNKLELLRTFVRVTELSSFTQAGESLGLPRSTVSEHVPALEELLGAAVGRVAAVCRPAPLPLRVRVFMDWLAATLHARL